MSETIQPGTLYIVSTPIGNLDDISRRAINILGGVNVIAAEDTRKTRILLHHLSIEKPLLSHHSYNEGRRVPELMKLLRDGKSIAIVTDAGTPGISDPASMVIRETIRHGFTLIPVPGANAVLPALVVSGLPTDRFVFEGFIPVKKGRKKTLEQLKHEERTIVMYESPFRIERTLTDILEYLGDRDVAVVRELTKKFEEVMRGKVSVVLAKVQQKVPRGEYVIVISGRSYGQRRNRGDPESGRIDDHLGP